MHSLPQLHGWIQSQDCWHGACAFSSVDEQQLRFCSEFMFVLLSLLLTDELDGSYRRIKVMGKNPFALGKPGMTRVPWRLNRTHTGLHPRLWT